MRNLTQSSLRRPTSHLEDLIGEHGIVDTHYHIGPELLPRKYNVASLAKDASTLNATIVLKNHTYPTTPLAALARREYASNFVGSVVLNRFVGGLNPDAILGAVSGNNDSIDNITPAKQPPIVVWMPTVHAASHLAVLGAAFDPRWSGREAREVDGNSQSALERPVIAFDDAIQPVPELIKVLQTVAHTGSRLATGHLSAAEIMGLIPLALELGVKGIIVTHPDYPSVRLSHKDLRALARYPNVFIEHCFAIHTIEHVPLSEIADSIIATGPEQIVLSTDFGQICSDPFPEGTLRFAAEMEALLSPHFTTSTIAAMFTSNGLRALGL